VKEIQCGGLVEKKQ